MKSFFCTIPNIIHLVCVWLNTRKRNHEEGTKSDVHGKGQVGWCQMSSEKWWVYISETLSGIKNAISTQYSFPLDPIGCAKNARIQLGGGSVELNLSQV